MKHLSVEQLHKKYKDRKPPKYIATREIERIYGFVEKEMMSLSKARFLVRCLIEDAHPERNKCACGGDLKYKFKLHYYKCDKCCEVYTD